MEKINKQSPTEASKIDRLKAENTRLLERLEEVVKMNTHWQFYDAEREKHVRQLTKTNQTLREQVRDLQLVKKEEKMERSATRCDEPAKKAAPNEVLSDTIGQLRERIAELEIGRKKEDDDQVALLREQLNVCVEDFKQERQDRERIHGDNLRLRERLAAAENEVSVLHF